MAQKWPTQTMPRRPGDDVQHLQPPRSGPLCLHRALYPETLINAGLLLPGLLAGFVIANLLVGRLDQQAFRRVVTVLVVLAGCMLLGRELLG